MLKDFVQLFDKPDEAILAYSRRWGVLGICEEHGLPIDHGCLPRGGLKVSSRHAWKYTDTELLQGDGDPIAAWRQFSEAANAILSIQASLNANDQPDKRLWQIALKPGPHPSISGVLDDVYWDAAPWWNRQSDSKILIELCINRWMRLAGVFPQLDSKDLSIRFSSAGLFGAIAVQLLLVVGGSEGWVICSNPKCHQIYDSPRRPKSHQRHFCPVCRVAGIPKKFADRAYATCRRAKKSQPQP